MGWCVHISKEQKYSVFTDRALTSVVWRKGWSRSIWKCWLTVFDIVKYRSLAQTWTPTYDPLCACLCHIIVTPLPYKNNSETIWDSVFSADCKFIKFHALIVELWCKGKQCHRLPLLVPSRHPHVSLQVAPSHFDLTSFLRTGFAVWWAQDFLVKINRQLPTAVTLYITPNFLPQAFLEFLLCNFSDHRFFFSFQPKELTHRKKTLSHSTLTQHHMCQM